MIQFQFTIFLLVFVRLTKLLILNDIEGPINDDINDEERKREEEEEEEAMDQEA